jgi:predicted XRE-type DNA-binding protein
MKTGHNPSVLFSAALKTAVGMASTSTATSVARNSKLSLEDVIMVKLLYHVAHVDHKEIADMFSISQSSVSCIINRKAHKHVLLNHSTKIPERFHEITNNKYREYKIKGYN